jgi:hypothetical protein
MARDAATVKRLQTLLAQITALTVAGDLHWERQVNSAHRYARWNNNLLILGPDAPSDEADIPRYLFITPFDSPACIEVNSADEQLGSDLLKLVHVVDVASQNEPPTDPFALTDEILSRLGS